MSLSRRRVVPAPFPPPATRNRIAANRRNRRAELPCPVLRHCQLLTRLAECIRVCPAGEAPVLPYCARTVYLSNVQLPVTGHAGHPAEMRTCAQQITGLADWVHRGVSDGPPRAMGVPSVTCSQECAWMPPDPGCNPVGVPCTDEHERRLRRLPASSPPTSESRLASIDFRGAIIYNDSTLINDTNMFRLRI